MRMATFGNVLMMLSVRPRYKMDVAKSSRYKWTCAIVSWCKVDVRNRFLVQRADVTGS